MGRSKPILETSGVSEELPLVPGCVALHDDGKGQHVAIVLDLIKYDILALFFTSNPSWGHWTRRAKNEEMALAGFVSRRETYLTLVRRHCADFAVQTDAVFGEHRIHGFMLEFTKIVRRR